MRKLNVLIFLLVMAAGIYYGWNMIPPYFRNYQFQDDLDDIARMATYNIRSDDELKQAVIKKALARDIVLKEDQLTLTRFPRSVPISMHYPRHADLSFHPTPL